MEHNWIEPFEVLC